ncbi:MAG: efflux RND transporter periplasmic adaptor subunit [Candidatus Aminicenantaceae bacterium]
MGMDRTIKKKKWPPKRIATYAAIAAFVVVVLYLFLFKLNKSTLNVEKDRLTISTVKREPFQEFIPVMGAVEPIDSYHLDAVEGGVVEEVFLESGTRIAKGDPILRLENTDLLMNIMWRESEMFQTQNNLRNTQLSLDQRRLTLSQQLAQVDNSLAQSRRTYDRYSELIKESLISQHQYELAKDEYDYWIKRRELTIESQKNDIEFRGNQVKALDESLLRMQENLAIIKQKLENLVLRAPISGFLTALDAEIGQRKNPGQRLGQIDVLDSFRVVVGIDEHWISRVEEGRIGTFDFSGGSYELKVSRKYMEVTDGRFEVDMLFNGEQHPAGMTRGMTLHIRLNLGDLEEAVVLARGGFFQTTGGNWVYVVDADETLAVKRRIRTNRYNTQVYEVVEGLEPGEKVITSSYESFGDMERLVLK